MAEEWNQIKSKVIEGQKPRILWSHYKVHIGDSYYIKDFHEFPPEINQIFELLVRVRESTILPYAGWEFTTNIEMIFELYQGTIASNDGEGIKSINNNFNAPPLPPPFDESIYIGPTIEDQGVLKYRSIFNESHIEGRLAVAKAELVGKNNTDYLFRFIKEGPQTGGWINYYINWYLH